MAEHPGVISGPLLGAAPPWPEAQTSGRSSAPSSRLTRPSLD